MNWRAGAIGWWALLLQVAFSQSCAGGGGGASVGADARGPNDVGGSDVPLPSDVEMADRLDVPAPSDVGVVDVSDVPLPSDGVVSDVPLPSDVEGTDLPLPSDIEVSDEPGLSDIEVSDVPLPSDVEVSDGSDGSDGADAILQQPPPACGMAPYEWLPATKTGKLLWWEENPTYHLPPALIEMLVQDAGYALKLPLTYTPRVFLIRYSTQDRGVERQASAMVGLPEIIVSDEGQKPFATALFLHGTAGYADKCAPSKSLEGGAAAILPASAGYIAVAPDYLGLCGTPDSCGQAFHPYLIGEATAIASLDAARAAFELVDLLSAENGAVPDGRIVPWGGSQGGHAALFVQRYAPLYAPEFEVPCVISMIPPANLLEQASKAFSNLGSAAELGTAFLAAAFLWYEPDAAASSVFNAEGPEDYSVHIPVTFVQTCNAGQLLKGAQSIEDVFAPEFLEAVQAGGLAAIEPWGCIAKENSLPTSSAPVVPSGQVLFIIGEKDELVDHTVERTTFQTLCGMGYEMEFVECQGLTHFETALQTINLQLEWVESCLSGQGISPEALCQLKDPQSCSLD